LRSTWRWPLLWKGNNLFVSNHQALIKLDIYIFTIFTVIIYNIIPERVVTFSVIYHVLEYVCSLRKPGKSDETISGESGIESASLQKIMHGKAHEWLINFKKGEFSTYD
jgi:hypothetical protein